jgi:hypothetical protein
MRKFILSFALFAVMSTAVSVSEAIAPPNKLQEFRNLRTAHLDTPLSIEIPCMKALLNASEDPIFNARDPASLLYVIGADKLLRSIELKRISEADAREKLLRMFLEVEDRHRPELLAMQAQQRAQRDALDAAEQRAKVEARRSEELEENRRATAQMLEAAQNREFRKQQDDLVAFCVATSNQRIRANPLYSNQHFGIDSNASCTADPYWYKTIPPLQSQVAGRVY